MSNPSVAPNGTLAGPAGERSPKGAPDQAGKEISDLAAVPLADLFQRLHSTDAADPFYERMTSARNHCSAKRVVDLIQTKGRSAGLAQAMKAPRRTRRMSRPSHLGVQRWRRRGRLSCPSGRPRPRRRAKRTGGLDEQICRDCLSQRGEDP